MKLGRRLALCLLVAASCTRASTPPVSIRQSPEMAKQSIARVVIAPARAADNAKELDAHALESVTAILAAAAARHPNWTVVAPEAVPAAAGGLEDAAPARAGRIAAETKTDVALIAEVTRYRERIGSDLGVSEPASVALRLLLVPAGAKDPVWQADYAHTQQPLAYNLWNFWQLERGGFKWLRVSEIARIGIDEALDRLAGPVPAPKR